MTYPPPSRATLPEILLRDCHGFVPVLRRFVPVLGALKRGTERLDHALLVVRLELREERERQRP
jgi:hypothetical protein